MRMGAAIICFASPQSNNFPPQTTTGKNLRRHI
jgi:hypothetical protein